MRFLLYFVAALALVSGQQPPALTGYDYQLDYSNMMTNGINPVPNYFMLYYTLNGTSVNFGFVAQTPNNGWASFGFASAAGNMIPSDEVMAWVDSVGKGYATDFTSIGRYAPTAAVCTGTGIATCPDSVRPGCTDNVVLRTVSRVGIYLSAEYTRPVAANDACDVAITPGVPQNIIFAVGPVTVSGTWPYKPQYHVVRNNFTAAGNLLLAINGAPTTGIATTGVATTGVATTGVATTGAGVSTSAGIPTSDTTTGAATSLPTSNPTSNPTSAPTSTPTSAATSTANPGAPPTLTGYANQMDLTDTMTNGFINTGVYYKLYYTVTATDILIGIVALTPQLGWASFGLSQSGFMINSGVILNDAILGWVDENGMGYITDAVLSDRSPPDVARCFNSTQTGGTCPDSSQSFRNCTDNIKNPVASRVGQYLVLEFKRPLIASDSCDLPITPGTPQRIIYAVGPVTGGFIWPYKAQFHSSRTNVTVSITFQNVQATATSQAKTSSAACPVGGKGCPCTIGAACDAGLLCQANICIAGANVLTVSVALIALVALLFQ